MEEDVGAPTDFDVAPDAELDEVGHGELGGRVGEPAMRDAELGLHDARGDEIRRAKKRERIRTKAEKEK